MAEKIIQGSRAIFAAKYLPLLNEFRATPDDVRYYLHGISIEPHETEGAYLVATDGHRIVVVHDDAAVIDAPMLVNPDKILIRESKRASLADFDGNGCDLQDDEERFLVRAPAPLIDAKFPDWRSMMPNDEDVVCEPGSINPDLMQAISKAPFSGPYKDVCMFVRQDKPCIVRIPSLPEIFILIMPLRTPAMHSKPEWARRKRAPAPNQGGFDLSSEDETREAAP